MRIILAAKSLYPFHPVGGVQKYVYSFAQALRRKGVSVEIVAPLDQGKPRTEILEGIPCTLLSPAIYKYLELPVGWWGVHQFSRSLARHLQAKSFDILHSFDMTGYHYLKNNRRRPVIAQVFTDNFLTNPISSINPIKLVSLFGIKSNPIKGKKIKLSPFDGLNVRIPYALQYLLKVDPMHESLNRAEAIFVEDDIYTKDLVAIFRIESKKCMSLPVGVDCGLIETTLLRSRLTRQDIGLKEKDFVVITVNRLAADKGVDKMIIAVGRLKRKDKPVKLLVIGEGYQRPELEALIKREGLEGQVILTGAVSEEKLYDYYKLADIYLSAFSYPGSSLSTMEAMACGLPIITTAQPWLVTAQNGIYISENDSARIAEAIACMQDAPLRDMGQVSRTIAKSYDWDSIAQKAIVYYEKLLNSKGQAS